jgi:hypothetical protein
MKNTDGALLGLVGGSFYFLFVFAMGMEAGGLVSSIIWVAVATLITFAFISPLVFWLPLSHIWLYPLTFALPTLLVGLLALTGKVPIFTFFAVGAATFLVGLAAAHIARKLAVIYRPRSNPALKRDALKRAP